VATDFRAWNDVRPLAEGDGRLAVLDETAARALVRQVKERFVADPRHLWWWESLRGETASVPYDDSAYPLEFLRARLVDQPQVNLIVTDNQRDPSGVVRGSPGAILDLLGALRPFEFALTDDDVRWLILDSHESVLVLAGDIPF
jgi:hypothetical protein